MMSRRGDWRSLLGLRPRVVWTLLPPLGAAACSLLLPPLVAFAPQPLAALGLVLLGALLTLLPDRLPFRLRVGPPVDWARRLRILGLAAPWGVIAWCVFSQEAPLTAPRSLVWSARALPLVLVLAVWLWVQLGQRWQRRAALAVALPTLVALVLTIATSTPRTTDFAPYYAAVDAGGTLYVSDEYSPVIRVFAPDGSLRAKLRPGLASVQGPPGPGFSPPGPYNDPDRLGVARATPGTALIAAPLRPWPLGADDFWFCGMATGDGGRLYVTDWMRGRMLRFAPDGRLEASWALPPDYHPSLGCVSNASWGRNAGLYLSDASGAILRLDPSDGRVAARWRLPEPIIGGISAAPDGALYVLARTRVYRLDPGRSGDGAITAWALPAVGGPLGQPYQAILALGSGHVLVADVAAHRIDVFTADGRPLGAIGRAGAWPGQFGQVGGLAADHTGRVYVADPDSRILQRFTTAGHIDALDRSPDDDEID
jgi:sugar lactone lactonase YvrE